MQEQGAGAGCRSRPQPAARAVGGGLASPPLVLLAFLSAASFSAPGPSSLSPTPTWLYFGLANCTSYFSFSV